MGERTKQSTEKSEDELWQLAYVRLVPWTIKAHRVNLADAEEMVQDAIRLFLKAGCAIDIHDEAGFLQKLGSNVNGIAVNRRRKKALVSVNLTKDGSPTEPGEHFDAEQIIVSEDQAKKSVTALLERVQGDELVFAIVMQMVDGVDEAAAQAQTLGVNVTEIYKARRRLKAHADAIEKLMEV